MPEGKECSEAAGTSKGLMGSFEGTINGQTWRHQNK